MRVQFQWVLTVLARMAVLTCLVVAQAANAAMPERDVGDALSGLSLDVPATRFVLPNGLTVIVHPDHSAPLVAVHIWYHVGAKNEPDGKSGLAHLYEHLMFNGSEHLDDDYFKIGQQIGASDQNGTTSVDRTDYYQTVPKGALDTILWLESDRMGHLLGAIGQAKLDEQRAVVKNEKQKRANQPYAMAGDLIMRAMLPYGHPYAHSVGGSTKDLDGATLDDVQAWSSAFYGPSNAVLVLAGDITPAEAKSKVEKHFGGISPGLPASRPTRWIARQPGSVRETAYDRIVQPRLYRVWNIPEYGSVDIQSLELLGQVLAGDNNSRLHRRLVMDEGLASAVSAGVDSREISGQFTITVDVMPDVDIMAIEAVVEEELQRLLSEGPTTVELVRIRTATMAALARRLQSLSGKANLLAESQTYLGSADGWMQSMHRYRNATPEHIQQAGRAWLSDGDYVLHLLPIGEQSASIGDTDRSAMPQPQPVMPAVFPDVERVTLANGMQLVVAGRSGMPLVNMTMVLKTGDAMDDASSPPGLASLAMGLLEEGTTTRTGKQIAETLAGLGATLQTSGGGTSVVTMSVLKPALRQSLALYADVVLRPAFTQKDLDRLKRQVVARIGAARQDPRRAAERVLPALLFGVDHPDGRLATASTLGLIGPEQVRDFHRRWFHPGNATLVVTGDTTLADIRPLVEEHFAAWAPGHAPVTDQPVPAGPQTAIVYLIDAPGAQQSIVQASLVMPPRNEGNDIARAAFNTVFGGAFASRLNMKLREEKGWSYGAYSAIDGGAGAQMFTAGGSVQADRTSDAMSEIAKLLADVQHDAPVRADEISIARETIGLGLINAWSANDGIARHLVEQQVHGLGDDYYAQYPRRIASISLDEVNVEAKRLLRTRPLTWVVVGDRARVELGLRSIGLGEVRVIDADGRPVP